MLVKDILRENHIDSYDKLQKVKDTERDHKLSEREIKELMSHSSYKRHKGAIKQSR